MPLTPQQALSRSPNAKLSDDEKAALKRVVDFIDNGLSETWDGGPFMCRTEPITPRTMGALLRTYERKHWRVTPQAIDGAIGSAKDLLAAGAPLPWQVTLIPDWRGEDEARVVH